MRSVVQCGVQHQPEESSWSCPFLDGIAGERASATVAQSGRSGKSKVGPTRKMEPIGGKTRVWRIYLGNICRGHTRYSDPRELQASSKEDKCLSRGSQFRKMGQYPPRKRPQSADHAGR